MKTIEELRRGLGWTHAELARQAKLSTNTVRKAENKEAVAPGTAQAIAEAFSKAYGRPILVKDIKDLQIAYPHPAPRDKAGNGRDE
ncbi:MAG: helix-turn-helix transcriptional regulator [Acidobacterium ailaaui]|nr:helix-turn-helix transcriptional regulator [Pseudacidobacterium ailaaui]